MTKNVGWFIILRPERAPYRLELEVNLTPR
jgi:hypothetical protein